MLTMWVVLARTARVMAALVDAPLQVPQEQVSEGQSPENAWTEAAVKELKIRTCDLVLPETTWKDSVRARTEGRARVRAVKRTCFALQSQNPSKQTSRQKSC